MKSQTGFRSSFRTADLAYMAIAAALLAICSWITIPATVPFTMQTFGIFLVLRLLGGRRGTISILVYLFLGLTGLPVFSGFAGGIGALMGNTGGYLAGFLLTGLVYWLGTSKPGKKPWREALSLGLGLTACYALGTAWFMVVYARNNGAVGLGTVLSWCVLPFVIPDLLKLALAMALSGRISRAVKLDRT